MKQFIIVITNRWTKRVTCYPVVFSTREEAEEYVKKSDSTHNTREVKEVI